MASFDEWSVVKGKGKGRKGPKPQKLSAKTLALAGGQQMLLDETEVMSVSAIIASIVKFEEGLRHSHVYVECVLYLAQHVDIRRIMSLGIGSMAKNDDKKSIDVMCFDPAFTGSDIEVCEHFGFAVMTDNTKGLLKMPAIDSDPVPVSKESDRVTDEISAVEEVKTLLYMPHCPYRLYCNVLWSYWYGLDRILLLGNSFQSYELRRSLLTSNADTCTDSVRLVTPHLLESRLLLSPPPSKNSSSSSLSLRNNPSGVSAHLLEAAFCELSFMQVRHDESEQALSHEAAPDNKLSSSGAPSSLQQLASIARPSWAALLEATANDVEVF